MASVIISGSIESKAIVSDSGKGRTVPEILEFLESRDKGLKATLIEIFSSRENDWNTILGTMVRVDRICLLVDQPFEKKVLEDICKALRQKLSMPIRSKSYV